MTGRLHLIKHLQTPAPCDGCQHWSNCKDYELACKAYHDWVVTGRIRQGGRVPSEKIYDQIFNAVEVA